jgi:16S rRNA (cytosine1402-N4)-methyltransferase
MQLDRPERGFSFRADGLLDMRMAKEGESAADVVNGRSERELADIIHDYGEERRARAIAHAIVVARQAAPITGTLQLAEIVRRAFGGKSAGGIDPATRTFQALRIYVNDELGELDRGLLAAEALLRSGGRVAVVTFHSLEDRRVKRFLRQRSGCNHLPATVPRPPSWREPDLPPCCRRHRPAAAEGAAIRARSATAAERTAASRPRDHGAEVAP